MGSNLTWIRVAAINVRPLLIKWVAIYLFLVFVYAAWLINSMVLNSNIQESQQVTSVQSKPTLHQEKVKLPNSIPEQEITLPPPPVVVTPTLGNNTKLTGSGSGNTYARGNCTWYAKSKRPDLPNSLGNANTWVARAKAQGIATGSVARPGAIAQRGMHVAYVETVNTNGTIHISEMNFIDLGKRSERTVDSGNYKFIY